MRIDTSGLSRQLPTAALFRNGAEVRRFPAFGHDGRVGRVLRFDARKLESYFELPQLYLALQGT